MNFKPYESKPVIRMAFQITAEHEIAPSAATPSTYYIGESKKLMETGIRFKAYEEPKVGDWVVRLTEDDTYHCTDAVFRERNIVPE